MRFHLLRRFAAATVALSSLFAVVHPSFARKESPATIPSARRKKLIFTGWGKPDAARLRAYIRDIEKLPFDGVVLELKGKTAAGKEIPMRATFNSVPWQRQWFQASVDDLKAVKSEKVTENFVLIGANPGSVDWFDDAGWKTIVEHCRIAAWVAKEGGLKGILFDAEPYTKPYIQFKYSAQAEHDRHTFAEYYAKARQRGREMMQAIVDEYPDITLFTYFMNSVNAVAIGQDDALAHLEDLSYGLYTPFINGWLDAAPPTVNFIDGCESAYLYNTDLQFFEASTLIHIGAQDLITPENRVKYRSQVQASFGIYLDAYWNPPTSRYYIDGNGGPRIDRLRANTTTALRAADEYVWIYGEQFRWWPSPQPGLRKESWEEMLPGVEETLRYARNPREAALNKFEQARAAGTLQNLTKNGDFSQEKAATPTASTATDWKDEGAPAEWKTWQDAAAPGKFSWDRSVDAEGKKTSGSARADGVATGTFIQSFDVKPGERYVVSALTRTQGQAKAKIYIRWQTPEGNWTSQTLDRIFFPATDAAEKPGGWREILDTVQVPAVAGKLVFLLSASGRNSPEDIAWFDNARLYRLP